MKKMLTIFTMLLLSVFLLGCIGGGDGNWCIAGTTWRYIDEPGAFIQTPGMEELTGTVIGMTTYKGNDYCHAQKIEGNATTDYYFDQGSYAVWIVSPEGEGHIGTS